MSRRLLLALGIFGIAIAATDKELKQALFELYEHWGNVLFDAGDKDYAAIVEKYER